MNSPMDVDGLTDVCHWAIETPEVVGPKTVTLLARALLAALDACAAAATDFAGPFDDVGLSRIATAARIRDSVLDAANATPEPDA